MLISNVLAGPKPRQNDTQPSKDQTAEQPATEPKEGAAPKSESKTSGETTAPQETARSEKAPAASSVQQIAPSDPAKTSRTDDEAFARAAAQRAVDSARIRALLDTIDPVQNAGAKAAQSYLTPVEPKAPATDEAKAANTAKPAPLEKAA